METIIPRFEFRAWSDDFGSIKEHLLNLGEDYRREQNQELYLVSADDHEHDDYQHNVKIRNNFLDIKILLQSQHNLEQWRPWLKESFPLTRNTVIAKVIPALSIVAPELELPQYTLKNFLAQVIQPNSQVRLVQVGKDRTLLAINNCSLEITEVKFAALSTQTIAIESVDAEIVLEMIKLLGLSNYDNLSYPKAIKQILN